MPGLERIGIVVALEREIRPLVRTYDRVPHSHDGRTLMFFESEGTAVVCGGIGPEAARRATGTLIAIHKPQLIVSAGFAGGLDDSLAAGDVFCPRLVIDALDGSRFDAGGRSGQLVSFGTIAGTEQKAKLAKAYQAQAVDMEAAAVARAASCHRVPFCAVKAISDELDFEMPGLERFVERGERAGFRQWGFAAYVMLRPWLWGRALQLASGSAKATRSLCRHLSTITHSAGSEGLAAGVDSPVRINC
jgi:adenosylhomocysteine nucleosidase